jgi:hypothetical protein|tara:strand:+ start:1152 stop:1571 length:420 start_codon:yes stop_codon:yes gene_type:complete
MSDTFDKLNETFNVEVDNTGEMPNKLSKITNEPPKGDTDVNDDYQYSRAQLYSLVEKGQEAIQGALEVAQSTDHPRAYEVAGNLIKNVADIADKLLDTQKKLKDIEEEKPKGPSTVNNSVFVGSTAELQKILKQKMSDK